MKWFVILWNEIARSVEPNEDLLIFNILTCNKYTAGRYGTYCHVGQDN